MTKDQLIQIFKDLGIEPQADLIISTNENFISKLEKGEETIAQALKEAASVEQILFAEKGISEQQYSDLLQKNTFVLMLGTDYTSCPVMEYAAGLCRRSYTAEEKKQAFHLAGTALENRFWGDEEVLRFVKIEGIQCRLLKLDLLVDYAADWMFKNKKQDH